jgi:hypothetical protein
LEIEERNEGNKAYTSFKSSLDLSMGILYIIIAGYATQMPFIIEAYGKKTVYIIGGLFVLYGLFRFYRGFVGIKNIFLKKRLRR